MTLEEFYDEIARRLGTTHEFTEPLPVFGHGWVRHDGTIRNTYKTRWNGRHPGNGRFPGRGIVRVFGQGSVQVALHNPPVAGLYASLADALDAIPCLAEEKSDDQNS